MFSVITDLISCYENDSFAARSMSEWFIQAGVQSGFIALPARLRHPPMDVTDGSGGRSE